MRISAICRLRRICNLSGGFLPVAGGYGRRPPAHLVRVRRRRQRRAPQRPEHLRQPGRDVRFPAGNMPPIAPPALIRMNIRPAEVTITATIRAGTVANPTGTVRPRTTGIHRGNTSPQRCTRPSVSTAPPTASVASAAPAHTPSPSSSSRSWLTPSGMPSAHANRVIAYPTGTATATPTAQRPQRCARRRRHPGRSGAGARVGLRDHQPRQPRDGQDAQVHQRPRPDHRSVGHRAEQRQHAEDRRVGHHGEQPVVGNGHGQHQAEPGRRHDETPVAVRAR